MGSAWQTPLLPGQGVDVRGHIFSIDGSEQDAVCGGEPYRLAGDVGLRCSGSMMQAADSAMPLNATGSRL